jgi:hypothetical protein
MIIQMLTPTLTSYKINIILLDMYYSNVLTSEKNVLFNASLKTGIVSFFCKFNTNTVKFRYPDKSGYQTVHFDITELAIHIR